MNLIIITPPQQVKDEALICNSLFAYGLETLHLRKPGACEETYKEFIRQIEPRFRNRIVIHEQYHLAEKYHLRGIHLKSNKGDEYIHYQEYSHISISCHTLDKINSLPFCPTYCFLSPVFDSISKQDYKSSFNELPDLKDIHIPVIALGGITPHNLVHCLRNGFQGVAALGYIWEQPEEALQRFIQLKTPTVMSIAGFDPSSGAGITADLKTFESCEAYGLGVCSAITFQNQDEYEGTRWTSVKDILSQCELQFNKYQPQYIKIGLIENFEVLDTITRYLCERIPDIRIIWDPILKASAGFQFHHCEKEENHQKLNDILNRLYLITPNTGELHRLFGTDNPQALCEISRRHQLNILWKGGHNDEQLSIDRLISPGESWEFPVRRGKYEKHGTGCVLSAAITAIIAGGLPLYQACSKAQLYVSRFMDSNNSKLGYHHIGTNLTTGTPSSGELRLQYITDHKENTTIGQQIEAVCQGGIRWVQLRMKGFTDEELLREGRLAKEICHRHHALFIVNDNIQIARQLEADGVHLGMDDMNPLAAREILGSGKIIGATCNTWEDVQLRATQKVDYIGLGPFTYTTTKEKLSPVIGLQGYLRILNQMKQFGINIPVFAIGGITETDIPSLLQTGIQGIALSGLIKNSPDITAKTKEIITIINYAPQSSIKMEGTDL